MLRSVRELQNYAVAGTYGKVGTVADFYFDDIEWAVRNLIIHVGNWPLGHWMIAFTEVITSIHPDAELILSDLTAEEMGLRTNTDTGQLMSQQDRPPPVWYYQWASYWDRLTGAIGLDPDTVDAGVAGAPGRGKNSTVDPNLRSVQRVIGYHIQARDGAIGHVKDFILEDETWHVTYLVIDTKNWLPGKQVLLAPTWVHWIGSDASEVKVDLERDTIKDNPEFQPTILN